MKCASMCKILWKPGTQIIFWSERVNRVLKCDISASYSAFRTKKQFLYKMFMKLGTWMHITHYITDDGNCKNSDFSSPGGGSSMFFCCFSCFFQLFSIRPLLLGHSMTKSQWKQLIRCTPSENQIVHIKKWSICFLPNAKNTTYRSSLNSKIYTWSNWTKIEKGEKWRTNWTYGEHMTDILLKMAKFMSTFK